MQQIFLFQRPVLKILLHRVQLHHAVTDWSARRKYCSSATSNLVQITDFHIQVTGFHCLRLTDTAHIPHLRKCGKVFIVMCLVHKQSISTQFFKGNKVIFSALVVQLIQLCLHCFLRAFQLLDRETISVLFFQFSDTIYDFMVLLLQNITLPLNRHWNLLELAVANNNGIKIASCNSAAEAFAVLFFKVLLCCNQNVCRRIQLQILCRPLLRQVIRHDNQRFSAQSKSFALLRCGNNFEG